MKSKIRRGSGLGIVVIVLMAIINVYLFGLGIKATSDYFNKSVTTKLFNTELKSVFNIIEKNSLEFNREESSINRLVFNNGIVIYERDDYLVVEKDGIGTAYKFINKIEMNLLDTISALDLNNIEKEYKVDNLIDVIVRSDRKEESTFTIRRVFYVK